MPQTLGPYVEATTLEGAKQTIAVGPVASQIAIKMLGTNGGGFFNASHRAVPRRVHDARVQPLWRFVHV
jgi:K+-transporting ATPase A subunit